jgi:hypothetical protein
MSVRRRAWFGLAAIVAAVGADVAANVVPLPTSWRPYLWAAWPARAVLLAVVVGAEASARRRGRDDPRPPTVPASNPAVAVQRITASNGGTAQGAVFGNVINHLAPAVPDRDTPEVPGAGAGGDVRR